MRIHERCHPCPQPFGTGESVISTDLTCRRLLRDPNRVFAPWRTLYFSTFRPRIGSARRALDSTLM
jgi:hypothetical protein